jgi:hypothetical protein
MATQKFNSGTVVPGIRPSDAPAPAIVLQLSGLAAPDPLLKPAGGRITLASLREDTVAQLTARHNKASPSIWQNSKKLPAT